MVVNIIELIENKRNEMLSFAKEFGFSSHQTIVCSQELDELLNVISNLKLETY